MSARRHSGLGGLIYGADRRGGGAKNQGRKCLAAFAPSFNCAAKFLRLPGSIWRENKPPDLALQEVSERFPVETCARLCKTQREYAGLGPALWRYLGRASVSAFPLVGWAAGSGATEAAGAAAFFVAAAAARSAVFEHHWLSVARAADAPSLVAAGVSGVPCPVAAAAFAVAAGISGPAWRSLYLAQRDETSAEVRSGGMPCWGD